MLVLELLTTWKAYSHKVLVKKKNMNEVAHKIHTAWISIKHKDVQTR